MLPTLSSLPGRRHDLHDADRADVAPLALIATRLLVALRSQHQRVEVVLRAVLLEEAISPLEALRSSAPDALCSCLDRLHVLLLAVRDQRPAS